MLNVANGANGEVGVIEGGARANSYGVSVGRRCLPAATRGAPCSVSWVARQTGATSYRNSYVRGWVTQARNGAYGLSVTTSPAPGDIVAFDWNGGANFNDGNEHIGIVRTVNGSSFTTVEGNTSCWQWRSRCA